jgi:hypothetical protein
MKFPYDESANKTKAQRTKLVWQYCMVLILQLLLRMDSSKNSGKSVGKKTMQHVSRCHSFYWSLVLIDKQRKILNP